ARRCTASWGRSPSPATSLRSGISTLRQSLLPLSTGTGSRRRARAVYLSKLARLPPSSSAISILRAPANSSVTESIHEQGSDRQLDPPAAPAAASPPPPHRPARLPASVLPTSGPAEAHTAQRRQRHSAASAAE